MILIGPQQPSFESPETGFSDEVQDSVSEPLAPQYNDHDDQDELTPWVWLGLIDPPPYLDNLNPAAGSQDASPTANVVLEILDTGAGVNLSSVNIWINGAPAVVNGVAQPGFPTAVSPVSFGYRFVIGHPDFALGSTVYVRAAAQDTSEWQSQMDEVYQFRIGTDTDPIVANQDPAPGSINVDKDAHILFDVYDLETDVVLNTVRVWVRGSLVYDGDLGEFVGGWVGSSITRISRGYHFELVPDRDQYHRAGEQSNVRVYAVDETARSVNASWVFTAAEGIGLTIYRFLIGSIRDSDEEQG